MRYCTGTLHRLTSEVHCTVAEMNEAIAIALIAYEEEKERWDEMLRD